MRATSSSRSSRPDAPPFPDASSIVSDRGEPASVLDVEAGDEALVDLENMPDGLIEQHFALKVSHDLVDLLPWSLRRPAARRAWGRREALCSPLLRLVSSNGLAPEHAPTVHAVRPVNVFGQERQNGRDVPSVEALAKGWLAGQLEFLELVGS
jgi:hypothetical protein